MALRTIIKEGDPILRMEAKPVENFDEKLGVLLDDMRETMVAEHGCGLAAPQIGLRRRVFVVDDGNGPLEFVNPSIIKKSGSSLDNEGCLSVPNRSGQVKRPKKLTIQFQDRNGGLFELKAEGYLARIICHEYDHLDGILFIDRLEQE